MSRSTAANRHEDGEKVDWNQCRCGSARRQKRVHRISTLEAEASLLAPVKETEMEP